MAWMLMETCSIWVWQIPAMDIEPQLTLWDVQIRAISNLVDSNPASLVPRSAATFLPTLWGKFKSLTSG